MHCKYRILGCLPGTLNACIIESQHAKQLHMLPNLIQKLTVCVALVLVGLVGGLGTGLHSVFDCCHHPGGACGCCPTSSTQAGSVDRCGCVFCDHAAESTADDRAPAKLAASARTSVSTIGISPEDCAICRLLSHFHSTPTADSPEHYVWSDRGVLVISIPGTVPDASLRLEPSRGPPV